jgi:type I restriction enzyme M protein
MTIDPAILTKTFEDAKVALAANPTEGQVETSIVMPVLKLIGYQSQNIHNKVMVRVKSGSKAYEKLEADLIAKDANMPTLVIEAKSPKVGLTLPDDYNQGMSYCLSPDVGTRFLFLTSGYSNRLYEADKLLFEFDLKNVFSNIENLRLALLGQLAAEKKLPTSTDIERFFTYSHNRMYAEDAIKPAEALHILTKLILIKTNEERGRNLYNLRTILDYEPEYRIADPTRQKEIENEIYQYLADCLKNVDTDLLQPEEKTISRNLSVNTIFEIIKNLYDYTLDSIPIERKGSAFDSFLNNTLRGRELGQFFTHRNIVNFMVGMATPGLKDKIIDPACGTGGFIEKSFLLLRQQLKTLYAEDTDEYKRKLTQLQNDQIFGIDKDGNVASLAKLSMSMNGDGHATIHKGNGLTFTNSQIREDSFDIVLTNPPFGSKSVVQVKDPQILSIFDMGYKYRMDPSCNEYRKTGQLADGQDIGVLFLERCMRLLKDDCFLGIILHDGIFGNSSYGYIRQFIRTNCEIKAIVKLSDQTFKPYSDGGGTETSILICRKGKEQKDGECFFAIADHVGYRFKRHTIIDDENDLPRLLEAFQGRRVYNSSKWIKLSKLPPYERLDPQYHCKKTSLPSGKFEPLKTFLKDSKIRNGFTFKSEKFGKGEFPLVKIAHLNNSLLLGQDLERIPTEYYRECKTVKLEEGDILLAMDGKKEFRASYIDSEMVGIAVNQRVAIIRVDQKRVPASYVFFVLTSKMGQKQLLGTKTQTATVAHLSNKLIENVNIPLLDDQTIAGIEKSFQDYVRTMRGTERILSDMSKYF